jgi:hypothetical protein
VNVDHRFLIPARDADTKWLSWWQHCVSSPGRIAGLSLFGDWFLVQPNDAVWRLDLLEGSFGALGVSEAQFWSSLESEQAQDEWLQVGHIHALEARGLHRNPGECYTYRVPPRIGGAIDVANMVPGPLAGYQLFCAQLHRQLDEIGEGVQILKLSCDDDGALKIHWRAPS